MIVQIKAQRDAFAQMRRWQISMLAQAAVQVSSDGVTNTSIISNYACHYGYNYNKGRNILSKNYNKHNQRCKGKSDILFTG